MGMYPKDKHGLYTVQEEFIVLVGDFAELKQVRRYEDHSTRIVLVSRKRTDEMRALCSCYRIAEAEILKLLTEK